MSGGVMTKRPDIPLNSPPESQALGIGSPGLGGGVLHPEKGVPTAMLSKSGRVWETRKGFPAKGAKPRRSSFERLGVVAAAVVAALTVTGCAERRAIRAEGEYVEGAVLERRGARVAAEECRPLRRAVVTIGRGGDVRREVTDIPGVC